VDLSGWGHYLFMGLIGLIIAGLVGMFVGGAAYNFLYSSVGVVLFTALTAYDTQMIKKMSDQASAGSSEDDFIRLSISSGFPSSEPSSSIWTSSTCSSFF